MVGTWFGRAFWGTGANRESKALVAHLAFAVLGHAPPGLVLEPRQRALDARAARASASATRACCATGTATASAGSTSTSSGCCATSGRPARWRRCRSRSRASRRRRSWRRRIAPRGLASLHHLRAHVAQPLSGFHRRRGGSTRSALLPAEPAHREDRPGEPPARTTARFPAWSPSDAPVTSAAESPSMTCVERQDLRDVAQERGRGVDVVEDAGDEDHREEDDVRVGRRGVEVRDHVREGDAERREASPTPATVKTASSSQSFGQPRPKSSRPASTTIATCTAALVTALASDAGQVRAAGQRRAVDALEHARLAQERRCSWPAR